VLPLEVEAARTCARKGGLPSVLGNMVLTGEEARADATKTSPARNSEITYILILGTC
jgi:hypothetical protein